MLENYPDVGVAMYADHYSEPLHLATERLIVDTLIREALLRGFKITVFDGEDWPIDVPTDNFSAITAEIAATDMTILKFWACDPTEKQVGGGRELGNVLLIHGNDTDVVSDYTDNSDISALVLWVELRIMLGEKYPWMPLRTLSDMISRAVEVGEDELAAELRYWGERWDEHVASKVAYERAYERSMAEVRVVLTPLSPAQGDAPLAMTMADLTDDDIDADQVDALLSGGDATLGGGAQVAYNIRLESAPPADVLAGLVTILKDAVANLESAGELDDFTRGRVSGMKDALALIGEGK